jgi:hypothetical protein
MQQAGAAAVRKGFLRDQFSRKVEVKVRNQHQLDYKTYGKNLWTWLAPASELEQFAG